LQDSRGTGAGLSVHADRILDRDRNSAERQADIGQISRGKRGVEIARKIGVDLRIDDFDPVMQSFEHFAG
jgi:hypothetical protein